jgi:maleylacetate reductase
MTAFTHDQPAVRIVFGSGAFDRLADELDDRRWLIVHSGSQEAAAGRLGERLGERCAGRFGESRRHVPA